ncbi:scabin-related ADP-ribosyltransferase [Raoultella planticola]|uniref:scabin-related ADP-ribosyltransferase n=1 Tax=Raoultella planticola TaxID=575 RepID=UPI0038306A51
MKIIASMLLLILSTPLYATDFVYRVDSRPPDVIFRDGFHSHGENRNIQQHIRGDSCATGSRDSAFIATTSDINETYNIARQYYSSSTFTGTLYRYRIRADRFFYPLAPSVEYLTSRGVTFSNFEQAMMREQSEVVGVRLIEPENIVEAVRLNYNRMTSQVSDGDGVSNANYVDIETEASTGVIPNIPVPQVNVRDRIAAFGALISACLSTRGVQQAERLSYDPVNFYDARLVLKQTLVNTR